MKKDQFEKSRVADLWRSESEAANTRRAKITASLKEQRLKRDAEIATKEPPVKVPKRKKQISI